MLHAHEIFGLENSNARLCLKESPLVVYTLLFVMIMGFMHVARFLIVILGMIIWGICWVFGCRVSLSHALITGSLGGADIDGRIESRRNLNEPLYAKGHGLTT